MRTTLLMLLAVTSSHFSQSSAEFPQQKEPIKQEVSLMKQLNIAGNLLQQCLKPVAQPLNISEIRAMLQKTSSLSGNVITKVLSTLECAKQFNVAQNNRLTIIDYSLPSSEKRLWIFDLQEKKLLFYTYVSHGIKSGTLLTQFFSNKYNSKASSIGIYKTDKAYYGREGISLKLEGLDKGFNDNAYNRSIVMHGGWYVEENFIKKYGRAGRSWGCPAVPHELSKSIIDTIKDNSLFVVYYPNDNWFVKSKFLNCHPLNSGSQLSSLQAIVNSPSAPEEVREEILFADTNKNNQYSENKPIAVISADNYTQLFHTKAPLERMLRRQINNVEYIALSNNEFGHLLKNDFDLVSFVVPVVIMKRGYYETQMKFVNMGKIKDVKLNTYLTSNTQNAKGYTVNFETKPLVQLKTTNRFIRWLGL